MTRWVAVCVVVGLGPALAAAQAPFVALPGGGQVPCDHPLARQAGLACPGGTTTRPTAGPLTAPFQVGHFYQRTDGSCTLYGLALARTWRHNRIAIVMERVGGMGCPAEAYYYDPTRPPDGWVEVVVEWPPAW